MTDSSQPLLPRRVRHEIRVRRAVVKDTQRVTTHRLRVTLAGEELIGFSSPGFDDHVKLIFPDAATGELRLPALGPHGIVWPEGVEKPVMRDYTPRAYDPVAGTLTVGFSLHDAGPATAWARHAKPGDPIAIAGPRGSFVVPVEYDWHLLIGDDAAIPAIARRLEELPAGTRAVVLLEVDGHDDELPLTSRADLDLRWHHRQNAEPGTTSLLHDALAGLPWPEGHGYVWIAGESTAVKALRAHVVQERGMDPKLVRASGYWRRGAANVHERIEE